VCIVPRTAGVADLLGNMESEGRLVVCLTRARVETSIHACIECFQMEEVPSIWKKCAERFTANLCTDTIVTIVEAPSSAVPLACASSIADDAAFKETDAFGCLWSHLEDIPQLVASTLKANPRFFDLNSGDAFYSTLLAVAEGYINEVVDSEVIPRGYCLDGDDDESIDSGDAVDDVKVEALNAGAASELMNESSKTDNDLIAKYQKCMRNRMDESAYAKVVIANLRCVRLVPNLLRTVSFFFNEVNAQVVPMVIHLKPDIEAAVTDMVHLQRLMWFCTVSIYKKDLGNNEVLYFMIKPHKMRVVQKHAVSDCRTEREALVICAANNPASEMKSRSYSYLGGGVPWDPPHGHGLVSRGVPIQTAERYLAVVLFFSKGTVNKECFIHRGAANTVREKEAKELQISQSVDRVTAHLQLLHNRFGSSRDLLKECNLLEAHVFREDPKMQALIKTLGEGVEAANPYSSTMSHPSFLCSAACNNGYFVDVPCPLCGSKSC
jgi:hypothetical protein